MPRTTQIWKLKNVAGDPARVQIWSADQITFAAACRQRQITVTDIIEQQVTEPWQFGELLDAIAEPEELEQQN